MATSWGALEPGARTPIDAPPTAEEALDTGVVADRIAWMATSPGEPVVDEVTITPLLGGWP